MGTESIGTPALWIGFIALILALLAVDLGVFSRRNGEVSFRSALISCCIWVLLALGFNVGVYYLFGTERALEFFAGYLIEQSLSVDNIFLFIVIFSFFKVPQRYRRRTLFYGILGAILMRGIFVFVGLELLEHFHWILYVFGGLLLVTALRMFKKEEDENELSESRVVRYCRKIIPSTKEYHDEKFFTVINGKRLATPLLLVLVIIELTDVLFALDSIPAVFAITSDSFIVFTSNIFAILGLRSLFFLLQGGLAKLEYLRFGLAVILGFVGFKMVISEFYKIPIAISLGIIVGVLAITVCASLMKERSRSK